MIGDTIMDYTLNGTVHECDGNLHAEMAPHGLYRCLNGDWLSIAVSTDDAWRGMATAMGQADMATSVLFSTRANRKANESELNRFVSAWTAGRDIHELVDLLQKHGVAAAKSQSSVDMVADPHLWGRGFYREVTDKTGQAKNIIGPSWKMSREATITEAAPQLGEHNGYVLGELLGLSVEQQQQLTDLGITR